MIILPTKETASFLARGSSTHEGASSRRVKKISNM
jgi:hypothetical protein